MGDHVVTFKVASHTKAEKLTLTHLVLVNWSCYLIYCLVHKLALYNQYVEIIKKKILRFKGTKVTYWSKVCGLFH